ncbi:hypothetical protein WG66_012416 [Moniliophthora roreri]|nr:hypothetical protein WG66_012416 [Moniliophthora roreri]
MKTSQPRTLLPNRSTVAKSTWKCRIYPMNRKDGKKSGFSRLGSAERINRLCSRFGAYGHHRRLQHLPIQVPAPKRRMCNFHHTTVSNITSHLALYVTQIPYQAYVISVLNDGIPLLVSVQ